MGYADGKGREGGGWGWGGVKRLPIVQVGGIGYSIVLEYTLDLNYFI